MGQEDNTQSKRKIVIVVLRALAVIGLFAIIVFFATGKSDSAQIKSTPTPKPTATPAPTPVPLSMTLNGEADVIINYMGTYIDEGVKAHYGNDDVSDDVKVYNFLDTTKLGKYIIKYIHRGRSIVRNIEVKDTQPPRIKLLGDTDCKLEIHTEFVDPLYEVSDNYDDDLLNDVKIVGEVDIEHSGVYELTYSVSDSSGNETSTKRLVEVSRESPLNQGLMEFNMDGLFHGTILEETEMQGEEYLKSTAFIGDSINVAFLWYGLAPKSQVWGRKSLTPRRVFEMEIMNYKYNTEMLALDMLYEYEPERVIFTMGIDAVGARKGESIASDYRKIIIQIRRTVGDVDIIIHNILPVHASHDSSDRLRWQPNNWKINKANFYIAQMCDEMGVYFLNSSEVLKSWQGHGKEDYYSDDGYHFNRIGQKKIMDYILTHALLN